MNVTLNAELIKNVVNTLKQIDVRGYDSMDRLVGLVMVFEQVLSQAEEEAKKQREEAAPEIEVIG